MSETSTIHGFPRNVLIGFAVIVISSIALAGIGRQTGIYDNTPKSTPVVARDLFFRDQPDGSVLVFDARFPQAPIEVVPPATNGFLRATVRGLARQRLRQDVGPAIPFRLTEWADGRLTLEDPVTHRKVEMEAFGITNEEAFARIITAKEPPS
jgi:putative photosynthetic complex assembly protein